MIRILYIQNRFGLGGINKVSSVKESWLAEHGYEVHNLNMLDEDVISPKGMYSPKIKQHGISKAKLNRLRYIPIVGRVLRYLYFRIKYIIVLLQVRPDIIVSTQPPLEPLSVIWLTFWKKRILEFHGWYNPKMEKDLTWRDKWYGKIKYRIYHIVCLTAREAQHMKALFGCQADCIPNPNFIHTSKLSNCEAKHVLSLARFSPQKNYIGFLPAWKKVETKHPDWTLELFGEGEDESQMRSIIERDNLLNVHIHPYTKNTAAAYLDASIYILPSNYEGFPLVLLESMAYGVPVVAYDCPCGPSEIIQDGVDGFVTRYKDAGDMADKINYLIEHKDIRKQMGQAAANNIKRFDITQIMNKWELLFLKLQGKNER